MKTSWPFLLIFIFVIGCSPDDSQIPNSDRVEIFEKLEREYTQLPEQAITINEDHRVYAQYANPTTKYAHGVLGDKIEAEQLVVVANNTFYEYNLESNYVYEDLRPRLYDVDQDGVLEIITIRSNLSEGAGIVIYKIVAEALIEYAYVEEIGTPNRWLNLVAIQDIDKDGIVELAWIQTPHIGGILKVAKFEEGNLTVLSEVTGYSNHGLEERNLCLSVSTEESNSNIIYVPNQSRNKIVGFTFQNNELEKQIEIDQEIDFAESLHTQYNFNNIVLDEVNCINEN